MKIRNLYLVLIAVFLFVFLFFIMASNVTSYSSVSRQKVIPSLQVFPEQYRFTERVMTEASVVKIEANRQITLTSAMQILPTNSTEKKKIEIEIDMLQRIESLLSDIKRRQDLSDSAQAEVKKEVKGENFLGQSSQGGNNLVSNNLHEGQGSVHLDTMKSNMFQLPQRNEISPEMGKEENGQSSQTNQFKPGSEFFGKIQSMLGKMVLTKSPENEFEMLKQVKSSERLEGNFSKNLHNNSRTPEVCDSCFKNDFKILINQESLCKHSGDLDLLIAVSSAPKRREARDAIRETWASTSMMASGNMKCVFFIGSIEDRENQMQLETENQQFHDIVQLEFKDSYSNLTYKTLSELRWVSEFCINTKYVMKTDSDMFVNTFLLPKILKGAPTTNFIGGDCWGPSPPHREESSKWYVSYKSYKHSSFPPMCSGTGYLMSKDLVLNILQISKNIPFFHLEDVFIALCTKKLHVKPVYLNGFSNMRKPYNGCTYRYRVATSHEVSPSDLRMYWSDMQNCQMMYRELGYDPQPYHPL